MSCSDQVRCLRRHARGRLFLDSHRVVVSNPCACNKKIMSGPRYGVISEYRKRVTIVTHGQVPLHRPRGNGSVLGSAAGLTSCQRRGENEISGSGPSPILRRLPSSCSHNSRMCEDLYTTFACNLTKTVCGFPR